MIDLTGGHLAQFLLTELFPIVSRHPRFRDNDGSALTSFSNLIAYKDVSLTIGNLRGSGTRLSFDHFFATALGRACVAKLEGMSGTFVEWIRETDPDDTLLPSGIYYYAVEAVNEETREVRLVRQTYRWLEGRSVGAVGSKIYLSWAMPRGMVRPVDPSVVYVDNGPSLTLKEYTPTLALIRTDTGDPLVPGTDFWIERQERHLIVEDHPGGPATGIEIPEGWSTIKILDDRGTELRAGQDWDWSAENRIWFASWLMRGSYYVEGTWRRTPAGLDHIHPENFLEIPIADGEELIAGQTRYSVSRGDFQDLIHLGGDRYVLKNLQLPGDTLRWEARIRMPQAYQTLHKMAVNPQVLPGLDVAIGDQVVVGDQLAIIAFPSRCEVFEIYGGKEPVNFDITVKSNDLLTSTELGNLVKGYLLVEGRDRLETLGLTIFEIATGYQGEGKDSSGTVATHSVTLSVSGMGDWEYHKPLVNRVDDIDVDTVPDIITYPGAPRVAPSLVAYGISRFTPAYQ